LELESPDHAEISRHRTELLAILAALDAFLAQCHAAAPLLDAESRDTEVP